MGKVTAAIIEKDGLILLAKRKKNKKWGGLWEFPGGKVRPEEKPESGLRRELREELGVEAEIGGLVGVWEKPEIEPGIELLVYKASIKGSPQELKEHEAICWLAPQDFPLHELVPIDQDVARFLAQQK